jgi:uridine phosphorylase
MGAKTLKNKIESKPTGRPTSYNNELSEKLLKMMTEGKSVTQFCAETDISKTSFYLWAKEYPVFADAFERGKEKCEAFWETWLHKNFANKEMNSALVKMFFANRFKWTEKVDTNTTVTIVKQEDALKELE